MSIFTKIVEAIGGKAGQAVGGIVDSLTTSDAEKSEAKERLTAVVMEALNETANAQAEVLKTELKGNWLQRSWRPIVMLTFTVIIVIGAFRPIPFLDSTSPFWSLLELGLGGYVVGRSVEKVADTVTKNVDIPFLKKKDRNKK